jgi:small subunit ribosomal protein S19
MVKKEFNFKGKSLEELQTMSLDELSTILTSKARRKIKRGFTDAEKAFLKSIRNSKKTVETHCRSMIILPEMVNKQIKIHSGKVFEEVLIQPEMIGHYLGEFAMTRKKVTHSAPGIGATKSSASISVK